MSRVSAGASVPGRMIALCAVGALCVLCRAPAARATERPAVAVGCAVESGELRDFWGDEATDRVASALCEELIERHLAAHPRLRFWSYRSAADAPDAAVTLAFGLLDGAAGETVGRLRFLRRDEPEPHCAGDLPAAAAEELERRCWQETVNQPGEEGDPLADEAPRFFADRIRDALLDHFLAEIEREVKTHAALARAVWLQPTGEPPRLVAALPWDDFQELKQSRFQVLCRRASNVAHEVAAVGEGEPSLFPGPPPITRALAVRVEGLAAGEVGDLDPHSLYLERYDPPTIRTVPEDFFDEGEP